MATFTTAERTFITMVIMMNLLSRVPRCQSWNLASRNIRSQTRTLSRTNPRVISAVPSLDSSRLFMSSTEDASAMSKSRAPFRMPRQSADDSKPDTSSSSGGKAVGGGNSWNSLGLLNELADCITDEMMLPTPTPVQSLVIPRMLQDDQDSLAFLAATGSGKTLAYLLPLIQQLKQQEMFEGYERQFRRPRLLVLVPTRELAVQITAVLKKLGHAVKLSSQALVGGQDKGVQRKALKNRPVDVVVATPGRLLLHWREESIFLGSVGAVVLDEMDTMLEQGFQKELRTLLYPLLYKQNRPKKDEDSKNKKSKKKEETVESFIPKPNAPRIVLTSATMTQTIQKLLGDNPKTSQLEITAKKLHVDPTNAYSKLVLPRMDIVSAPGLHKAIPRLEQVFVDVGNTDKISLLVDVVSSNRGSRGDSLYEEAGASTIIFCNTAASVRAVQYALQESKIASLAYHGDLNSAARAENLKKFRDSEDEGAILVCTDLAARGLDIPQVDNVVMFDFPLNAMDYLHRSGRTARGAGNGKVTALVAKRDRVLAMAIEQAVVQGKPLDGLSSRKSDYLPGAKFGVKSKKKFYGKQRGGPKNKSRSKPSSRRS